MQFDTVSFNDHSLFTIKAPAKINIYFEDNYLDINGESRKWYPNAETLDSHNGHSFGTSEIRDSDSSSGYTNRISGYPARIGVNVANSHRTDTFNNSNMTKIEFDAAEYTQYYFGNSEYINLTYIDANPTYVNDPPLTVQYRCDVDFSNLTDETYWTWDVTNGTSNNDAITSIDDFETILNTCKAAESENMADTQRVNKYFSYTSISVYAQIKLDEHTLFFLNYSFDQSDYNSSLGVNCGSLNNDAEQQTCDATVAALDRNFSDDFNEQARLPRKLTREEFVKQLFTLFDHVVISGNNSED